MFGRRRKPAVLHLRKGTLHDCRCGCRETVQILKVDTSGPEPLYKVAYYNAIFGGRHWVDGRDLQPSGSPTRECGPRQASTGMSPMELFFSGGGTIPNERVAAILWGAEMSHRRQLEDRAADAGSEPQ